MTDQLPAPSIRHDRRRQLKAMITLHRRAEAAFLAAGKIADAESAKREAEKLESELRKLEGVE